jgi:hypothetical protein
MRQAEQYRTTQHSIPEDEECNQKVSVNEYTTETGKNKLLNSSDI